jgi:hypothetical protein
MYRRAESGRRYWCARCRSGHFAHERHSARPCRHPTGTLRASYREWLEWAVGLAEEECNGYLVGPVGAARGITGYDLYAAHRSVGRHASADLKLAWARGIVPLPMTFTEFREAA